MKIIHYLFSASSSSCSEWRSLLRNHICCLAVKCLLCAVGLGLMPQRGHINDFMVNSAPSLASSLLGKSMEVKDSLLDYKLRPFIHMNKKLFLYMHTRLLFLIK